MNKLGIRWAVGAVIVVISLAGCPLFLETSLLQSVRDLVDAANASTVAAPTVSGSASTSDTTPTWSWNIPYGAVLFRYQVDSETGAWTVVAGGVDSYTPASALTLGLHTLYVQAGSATGNWSVSGSCETTIVFGVPGSVTATQGTSTAHVSLAWDSVGGAVLYRVYRDTSSVTPPASELDNTATTAYDDASAIPGQLYYYWIRAEDSGSVLSDYSSYSSGYKKLGTTTISSASNGTSTAHIVVTFGTVTGATSYQLYRSTETTAPIDSTTPTIIDIASSPYQDTGASAGIAYYYWVRAASSSSSSTGAWSTISDSGYKKLSPPVLSLVPYEDNGWVSLDWPVVQGATSYVVERRQVTPPTSFTPIDTLDAGQTAYEDYPGTFLTFEYRVFASCPLGYSDASNTVSVYTNIAG